MLHNANIMIDNIRKKGNKVLIWGACEQNNYIVNYLQQQKVEVVGYIDRSAEGSEYIYIYNGLPVFDKNIIKSKKCFIFVGLLDTYPDIIDFLANNNYSEFQDYWYPCRTVTLDGSECYKDMYGNEYVGEAHNIRIALSDQGKLRIGSNCKIDDMDIKVTNMSEINIGSLARFTGKTTLVSQYSSIIDINDCTTSESNLFISSIQHSKVTTGKDCMFSYDVTIRAGNSHNIFDMESGQNLSRIGRCVTIGEHVWLGQRACLFNGCEIGSGSIVGINTFVNKKFPNNCSIAGNPARIIKNNVAWRRENSLYFDSYDDFEKYDYR